MPISEIAPLSRERSLPERVAERMLQLITSKGWEQGKRIPPERDLAVAFGVSRTVIREAVKTLEARGVLENRMGSGVYVRQTDSTIFASSLKTYVQLAGSSEIRKQLVEIRRILEIGIAQLAAERATPEQCAELLAICQRMRNRGLTPHEMADLDFQFHTLLAQATQNEMFRVMLAPLIEQLHDVFVATWDGYGKRPVSRVQKQHEAIANAVARGDAQAAQVAMTNHMDYSMQVFTSITSKPKH